MIIDTKILDKLCRENYDISSWDEFESFSIQGNFIFVYYVFMKTIDNKTMKMIRKSDYIEAYRDLQLKKLI